ncbi:polysaccharide deacetylase family protein [Aquisalimonas sp. 2447]|uniref:polysaccharide deacetylase family protein n=1 Tax=Aquisalimonas sp. 2447 TaxID=2740807 RepID=UPI0014323096|nr:polysaccharide deacetylase family protein [Aquisalimonas sp. 2447]QIT56564.1 polysaccharide deacetylase family protein [Aquisalimonas sp. 2447]
MTFSPLVRIAGPFGLYELGRQLSARHPRILMYHRFSHDPQERCVSRGEFERQVRHLAKHYNPVTLGDLLARLNAGESVPRHTVVITVDDGHADFHDVAWPVLKAHKVPATLFVATGFIDGELWLWPDQVTWILSRADELPETLNVAGASIVATDLQQAWSALINVLLSIPDDQKHRAILELSDMLQVPLPSEAPDGFKSVTWDQLRHMQDEGLEVGGHTHTHPSMTKVDEARLPRETAYCLERLSAELGPKQRPFCYPNGQPDDVGATVRDAVANAGFTGAVVAYADGARHEDPFYLKRHGGSDDWDHFRKVVSGVEWLGWRVRSRGIA